MESREFVPVWEICSDILSDILEDALKQMGKKKAPVKKTKTVKGKPKKRKSVAKEMPEPETGTS